MYFCASNKQIVQAYRLAKFNNSPYYYATYHKEQLEYGELDFNTNDVRHVFHGADGWVVNAFVHEQRVDQLCLNLTCYNIIQIM